MRPPSLVQFGPDHGEGCGHLLRPFSPFPYGPLRPNTNSRNSPVLRKIPESLGTFPMSENSRPIYESLPLDHFETPRHVPDLIRDSELLRPFSPFPYGPLRPNTNSRNSPVLRKIPESLGTFPMSENSRPIYESLPLDHFETPRHVPDLIRDSELLRYIETHKLII